MQDDQFSRGPWQDVVEHGSECRIYDADNGELGRVFHTGPKKKSKRANNARLMATARDLLEACQAQEAADQHANDCDDCNDFEGPHCEKWAQLDLTASRLRTAAIARATSATDN